MQTLFRTSDSQVEITKALITFHKEMGKIVKASDNPFFKSKYAELPDILDGIKDPLEKAELTFVQFPVGRNGLLTRLMHASGEWQEGTYFMSPVKDFKKTEWKDKDGNVMVDERNRPIMITAPEHGLHTDPQKEGSVITYQRRYALGAILGLNIDKDDDGNTASGLDSPASSAPASASRTRRTTEDLGGGGRQGRAL